MGVLWGIARSRRAAALGLDTMNDASVKRTTAPELLDLNRALKTVGLRPLSPAAYQVATQHFSASSLVETARSALKDERSRQWLINVVSKSESTSGGVHASARGDDKAWSPLTVHVYGNQAALCFEPTVSSSKCPTVAIDAALKNEGLRTFDWGGHTQVNLTRSELVEVTACLLGFVPQAEGRHHGPQKNKGFRVANQGRHFFFEVSEGEKPKRGVRIGPADAHYVTGLLLRQLQNASPWMSVSDIITMLRCRAPMLNSTPEARQ